MVTARIGPRACRTCRLQLLAVFEPTFTHPSTPTTLLQIHHGPRSVDLPKRNAQRIGRNFSSSTSHLDLETKSTAAPETTSQDIESVVRHARQTFGETLPKDFLSAEEYALYERLYGPPVRATVATDLEFVPEAEEEDPLLQVGKGRNVLLRENATGEFEEVEFEVETDSLELGNEGDEIQPKDDAPHGLWESVSDAVPADDLEVNAVVEELQEPEEIVEVHAHSQRELNAILRLQRDMEAAMAQPAEEEAINETRIEDPEEDEDLEQDDEFENEDADYVSGDSVRTHPNTMAGRYGTSPRTLQLPHEEFILPISELLSRADIKHTIEAAEKAFGGPGLPYSAATPGSMKSLPQKHIGLEAGQNRMSEIEADAYLAAVLPGAYASVMNVLVEVRKRLGSSWLRDLIFRGNKEGPRVLDAGIGGAGLIAWREIMQAEWDVLRDEGAVEGASAFMGKSTALTGPTTLRHRMSRFLENTTFLPRLPDYVHSANPEALLDGSPASGRKSYDVIIAPHTLLPLKEDFKRKNMVENLWELLDPNGGVLILIEKGLPRGFEAIAGARSLLLEKHISSPGATHISTPLQSPIMEQVTQKGKGMIIAPCTNHQQCPMYPVPGLSSGRKDFCHFGQRFIRPPFLQSVLKASSRNHEDVKFSYIALQKGIDMRESLPFVEGEAATASAFAGYETEFEPPSEDRADTIEVRDQVEDPTFHSSGLPRAILPPIKRRGHVTLDLCTPSGTLERWTVPKSFSRQAYRDARKSKWGDLWALGAKTRTLRKPRLGREQNLDKIVTGKGRTKGRDLKAVAEKKRKGKHIYNIEVGEDGIEGVTEQTGRGVDRTQRRMKGGRREQQQRVIRDDDDL